MTARAMLLSDEEMCKEANSHTCKRESAHRECFESSMPDLFVEACHYDFTRGARHARTLYEAERNRLLDEIERMKATHAQVRSAVAKYIRSEGCDCCQGMSHGADKARLAVLLEVPKYSDGSGFDFYSIPLPEKHEEKGRDHE